MACKAVRYSLRTLLPFITTFFDPNLINSHSLISLSSPLSQIYEMIFNLILLWIRNRNWITKGFEPVGRAVRHPSWWRHLRESAEECQPRWNRPSFAAGKTRRQDFLAIQILLVPSGRTFPAEHLQQIFGFVFPSKKKSFDLWPRTICFHSCTHRRSRHLAYRRNLVSVTAHASPFTIRRHQPGTVLQRWQPTCQLRRQLHVHTQSRYSTECHCRSRFGRWSTTTQFKPSIVRLIFFGTRE